MFTTGVEQKGAAFRLEAAVAVRSFADFTQDNDPHLEHDFGSFLVRGERFFWKIDYYDLNLTHGSDAPEDPSMTKRVLTIMLASEY